MSLSRVFILWLLVLLDGPVYAINPDRSPPDHIFDQFFTVLPGTWTGQAIETPVGPVDYAITFHLCDQGVIAGVSELSVSDHHWRFWRLDNELRLTFLSTFRGNQDPTQLVVSKTEQNTVWFHAPELGLLTLSLTLAEPVVDIRVFHHHQPHVYIRLTRSSSLPDQTSRTGNEKKSCKKL